MKKNNLVKCILFLIFVGFINVDVASQASKKLHLEVNPIEIGDKVANNIVSRRYGWRYQKICSYYGALIYAAESGNKNISIELEKGFSPYLEGKKTARSGHVDFNVFGIWPFELYKQTGNNDYLKIAKELADNEYSNPQPDGLSDLSRFWVDDMYMVGSLQVQAYKSLNEDIYLNRAALQIVSYIDSLQGLNGLFYHRPDAPHYWGRGNGWAAAAIGELLSILPEDHEHYDAIVSAYRKMMDGLIEHQGSDGMWHQIIDDHKSFAESSCTGMFLFSMIKGIQHGILKEKKYYDAVEKGWNSLCTNYINDKGEVLHVSMWTNAKKRVGYYYRRPKIKGDYHGQAAVLWASTAMLSLIKENN